VRNVFDAWNCLVEEHVLLALREQLVHAKRFFFHSEEENRFSRSWKKKIVLPAKVKRFRPLPDSNERFRQKFIFHENSEEENRFTCPGKTILSTAGFQAKFREKFRQKFS